MDLILYHKGCTDGWCAAFIAKKKFPEAELFACGYGDELPLVEVKDKEVLVVDFSWPREQTLQLKNAAKKLVIYDHHKTAQKELEGLDFAVFDMNKSGAGITWDKLFPEQEGNERPWYVNYVEDYDLWSFRLPYSREINLYLHSLPHEVDMWNTLDETCAVGRATERGFAIRCYQQSIVDRQFGNLQFGIWGAHVVGIVNASAEQSELGEKIYTETPADIAMMYYEDENRSVHFSLRSSKTQVPMIDVGALAHTFPGGGGHPNAAGFELPVKQARKFIDTLVRTN